MQAARVDHALGQPPVEELTRAGFGPSTSRVRAPYSGNRSMLRCPAGKRLDRPRCTRSATQRVSSADSKPCSCTARSPICPAISTTRRGDSSRKTPTVTVSWGRRLTMSATADGAIWRGEGAKMKPTAEAPMPTASRASASEVTPQILTNSSGFVAGGGASCPCTEQAVDGRRPVGRADQRLPHQHGGVPGGGQAPDVGGVPDARTRPPPPRRRASAPPSAAPGRGRPRRCAGPAG